jgi:hypothetical protein
VHFFTLNICDCEVLCNNQNVSHYSGILFHSTELLSIPGRSFEFNLRTGSTGSAVLSDSAEGESRISAEAVDVSSVMLFVCLQCLGSRSACVFVQSTSVRLNIRRTELISDSVGLFR